MSFDLICVLGTERQLEHELGFEGSVWKKFTAMVVSLLLAVEGIPALGRQKNWLLVHFCLAQVSNPQIFAVNGSNIIAEGPGGTPECSSALRDSVGSGIPYHPNNPHGKFRLILVYKKSSPLSHWKFPLFQSPISAS